MKKSRLIQFLLLANQNTRIGGMCLGLIACLLLSPFVFFARSDVQFTLEGETVDARVVAPPTIVRTKFSTCYSYPVEYHDASGKVRSGAGLIRDASLKTGDIISMRYLRSDPARSRSVDGLKRSWPTIVFALFAAFILLASIWTGGKGICDILKQLSEKPIEVLSTLSEMAEQSGEREPPMTRVLKS